MNHRLGQKLGWAWTALLMVALAAAAESSEAGGTPAGKSKVGESTVAALERLAEEGKYAFVLFYRADDEATRSMRAGLEAALEGMADRAEIVTVDVSDPAQRVMVNRFRVSRAPLPLVLSVAPSGAVTRAWVRHFNAQQLEQAFVSQGQAKCLKAMQERKTVFVCIQNDQTEHNLEALQGVNEFVQDPALARRVELVMIDPDDDSEAAFLKTLRVSPATREAVTVVLAPPGRAVARFTGPTSKAALVAAMQKAASSCTPGSGCCGGSKKPAGGKKQP